MTDNVFIPALSSKGAGNVLEMKLPIGINIVSACVDYSEVALAETQGYSELKVLKIRLATLVFCGAGIKGFRIELLELLDQIPNNFPVVLHKLMLATVFKAIPNLVFKDIELSTFHRGLG